MYGGVVCEGGSTQGRATMAHTRNATVAAQISSQSRRRAITLRRSMRAPRRIATEKAVAVAKSTAQDALPPGALSKARQLAKRVLK